MDVSIRMHTSSGQEIYTILRVNAHPALQYINNGYLYVWDYVPVHMLAIYREYWRLPNNLPWTPELGTDTWGAIEKYEVSFNMWYANLQIKGGPQIIMEIGLENEANSNDWRYIDLKADPDGNLLFYIPGYGDIQLNYKSTDPHSYRLVLRVYGQEGKVEVKLFIDRKLVVDENTTEIYGFYIENICFGVWDVDAMSMLYLDKYHEIINYVYEDTFELYSGFNDTTKVVFTSYVDTPGSIHDIEGYPTILYGGKLGFTIEE